MEFSKSPPYPTEPYAYGGPPPPYNPTNLKHDEAYGSPMQQQQQALLQQQAMPQTQVIVVAAPMFTRTPMDVYCSNCKTTVRTRIQLATNILCCCILCFFGGLMALFLLCYDGLKDAEHYCPTCNSLLGRCKGWQTLNGNKKAAVIAAVVLIVIVQSVITIGLQVAMAYMNAQHDY